jgi:AraC-like DNA-binding protein
MIDIISFLGVLSACLIFLNIKNSNKYNVYLGFFFLSMSSFIIGSKIISLTTNFYIISFFFPVLTAILMSSGPMLYFYTKSVLNQKKHTLFDSLHYLPIFLLIINVSPFYLKSKEYQEAFFVQMQSSITHSYKIDTLFCGIHYFFIFRFVSGILYSIWCIRSILNAKAQLLKNKKSAFGNHYYWIIYLSGYLILNFTTLLFSIVYIKYFSTQKILTLDEVPNHAFASYFFWFGIICSIIFIPSVLFNPKVIFSNSSGDSKSKKKNQIKDFKTNSLEESLTPIENDNVVESDTSSNFSQISEKLSLYFYGKPYLQPGFNLSIITNETDIPYHKVTSYFTVYLGIAFNDWKNDMRVEHAIELIKYGQAKNQTIESIGSACGFLSRSNFINSFKKKTGLTPSEYIKTLPESDLVVSLNF